MSLIKVNKQDLKNTDDEIRLSASKCSNGEYANTICKGCGAISYSPNGDYRLAKLLTECEHCMIKERKETD